jgi:hypothetical protein
MNKRVSEALMLLPISNRDFVDDMLLATMLAGQVLKYAANCQSSTYDEEDFKRKTKDGVRLVRKKEVIGALKKILALPKSQRKKLWAAFNNDANFHDKLDDATFDFGYRNLAAPTKEAGNGLLLQFYKILKSESGFSKLTGQQKKLNGAILEKLYRQGNKDYSICPACLASRLPAPVDRISQNDREHYFPQSIYPPLAVHPFNLAIACITCNQRRHSNIDPITKHKAGALLDSFVPYSRPGIEDIELEFNPSSSSSMVRLAGKKGRKRADARARNFDRMYKLSQYWSDILISLDSDLFTIVIERLGSPPAPEEVKRELEFIVRVNERMKFTSPTAFLQARYADWIVHNRLDLWLKSWLGL